MAKPPRSSRVSWTSAVPERPSDLVGDVAATGNLAWLGLRRRARPTSTRSVAWLFPSAAQAWREHQQHQAMHLPRLRSGKLLWRRTDRKPWPHSGRVQQQLHVFGEVRDHGSDLHPALLFAGLAGWEPGKLQRFQAVGLLRVSGRLYWAACWSTVVGAGGPACRSQSRP